MLRKLLLFVAVTTCVLGARQGEILIEDEPNQQVHKTDDTDSNFGRNGENARVETGKLRVSDGEYITKGHPSLLQSTSTPTVPLEFGNLLQNNLNGFGPDTGEQEMRFGGVTEIEGRSVDLVITSSDYDRPSVQDRAKKKINGIVGSDADSKIAKVVQEPGSSASFEFHFEDAGTKAAVEVSKFALTFIDVDGNSFQDLRETVNVCGAESFALSDHTRLGQSVDQSGCFSFTPTTFDGQQNPKDPTDMTDTQKDHAVTVLFSATRSFTVTSSVTENVGKNTRPLLFAGIAAFAPKMVEEERDIKEEEKCKAVTIDSIHHHQFGATGKYFFFNRDAWEAEFGPFETEAGTRYNVEQTRDGDVIWTGYVLVWTRQGRRDPGPAPGQFEIGDTICRAPYIPPVEEKYKAVTVDSIDHPRDGKTGQYFFFNRNAWEAEFGPFETEKGTRYKVEQERNGDVIWTGYVLVWTRQGRRDPGWAPGQFEIGDTIRRAPYIAPNMVDEHCTAVTVDSIDHPRDGETGQYFFFNRNAWEAEFGLGIGEKKEGTRYNVDQTRDGAVIWTGSVLVWDNHFGVHGRRDPGWAPDQFKTGDTICRAPDYVDVDETADTIVTNNAGLMKSRYDSKCMDYNYNNQNVYMHACHDGANQKWYMDNERLKTNHANKCLDMNPNNNNVYMHACHAGANQQWFFDGEDLKTRHDTSKCLDYNYNNGNIYMHACHGGNNQKYYWAQPVNAAFASRVKSRHGDKCMDYNYNNGNIYFHTCHDGQNQKFYLDETDLKSLYGNKCADYNYNNQNVYMHSCHGGTNQQWYFDGEALKTKYNNNCLDLHTGNNNVYMHNCHSGGNQDFYMETVMNALDHDEVPDEIHQEEIDERDCKGWCYSKKHKDKDWKGKKCAWKSCAKCNECN